MIYEQSIRYGVDKIIHDIQIYFEKNIRWDSVHIYPKVHNINGVPQINLTEQEYTPVFNQDTKIAEIGFYVKNREVSGWAHKANVDIIFTIDLQKLGMTEEEVICKAEKVIIKSGFVEEINNIQVRNDVFKDFNVEGLRIMFPYFAFSFETVIQYDGTTEGSVC